MRKARQVRYREEELTQTSYRNVDDSNKEKNFRVSNLRNLIDHTVIFDEATGHQRLTISLHYYLDGVRRSHVMQEDWTTNSILPLCYYLRVEKLWQCEQWTWKRQQFVQ